MEDYKTNVFKRASRSRNFEQYVFDGIREGMFKFPIYLSAGQEYISASIAELMAEKNIQPNIFIQHRGHSTYLSFDAPMEELIDELLGRETGCAYGMGGSATVVIQFTWTAFLVSSVLLIARGLIKGVNSLE